MFCRSKKCDAHTLQDLGLSTDVNAFDPDPSNLRDAAACHAYPGLRKLREATLQEDLGLLRCPSRCPECRLRCHVSPQRSAGFDFLLLEVSTPSFLADRCRAKMSFQSRLEHVYGPHSSLEETIATSIQNSWSLGGAL